MKHLLLCVSAIGVCAVALSLPPIPQDPAYHQMADRRAFSGLPNALDVVSNLPFAVVGGAGLIMLMRRKQAGSSPCVVDRGLRWTWITFFAATAATALGSVYYHLSPSNARVVWDRLPIAIACASLVTAVIGERVNRGAARLLFVPLIVAAAGSVVFWYWSELAGHGDLRPYVCVQFGSLFILVVILFLYREPAADTPFLVAGLAAYGVAKVCELADRPIYEVAHLMSGHTMKHLAAATGVACVLAMLRARVSARLAPTRAPRSFPGTRRMHVQPH
jgi:predicted membrane channel-forming protein YqfA (hemolysin III family)